MLTILFIITLLAIVGKLIGFAFKATWGIFKIVCGIILLPLFLIGMVLSGLIAIAFPILIIIGLLLLFVPSGAHK